MHVIQRHVVVAAAELAVHRRSLLIRVATRWRSEQVATRGVAIVRVIRGLLTEKRPVRKIVRVLQPESDLIVFYGAQMF